MICHRWDRRIALEISWWKAVLLICTGGNRSSLQKSMRSRYSRNAVDRINRVIKTAHEHLKLSLTCLKLHKKKKKQKRKRYVSPAITWKSRNVRRKKKWRIISRRCQRIVNFFHNEGKQLAIRVMLFTLRDRRRLKWRWDYGLISRWISQLYMLFWLFIPSLNINYFRHITAIIIYISNSFFSFFPARWY